MWECDTPLSGLVRKVKGEENVEDLGIDGDELASTRKNDNSTNDLEEQNTDDNNNKMDLENDEEEKVTIHYKKVAK